jgi:hypothetical protein
MAKVTVNGATFKLRIIGPLAPGQQERFGVSAWLQMKYSLSFKQSLPFFAKRALDKKAMNLLLFSDESNWKNAENYEVWEYARDLRATITAGPGEVRWYTIPYPTSYDPLPQWAQCIQFSAKLIHVIQRLRGYPETLTALGLNNLAILIACGPEYFFLRCPADLEHARDMIFAATIDTARPAFVINLESPIPRFFPPRALKAMAGIAEGIWREEIRKQIKMVLQAAPLVIQFPPRGCGLLDIAMSDPQYVQLLPEVGRGGGPGERTREREREEGVGRG